MASLRSLKREARESATWRGHKLRPFVTYHDGKVATATCRDCPVSVTVNTHPAPNEIDIGGDAVAINCPATWSEHWHCYV